MRADDLPFLELTGMTRPAFTTLVFLFFRINHIFNLFDQSNTLVESNKGRPFVSFFSPFVSATMLDDDVTNTHLLISRLKL